MRRLALLLFLFIFALPAHAARPAWFRHLCNWASAAKKGFGDFIAPDDGFRWNDKTRYPELIDRVTELTDRNAERHPGRWSIGDGWSEDYLDRLGVHDISALQEVLGMFGRGETSAAHLVTAAWELLSAARVRPLNQLDAGGAFRHALDLILASETESAESASAGYVLHLLLTDSLKEARNGDTAHLDALLTEIRALAAAPDLRRFRTLFDKAYYLANGSTDQPEGAPELLDYLASRNATGQYTSDIEIFVLGMLSKITDELRYWDKPLGGGAGLHNAQRVKALAIVGRDFITHFRRLGPLANAHWLVNAKWNEAEDSLMALRYDSLAELLGGPEPNSFFTHLFATSLHRSRAH